jgi:hypothetical protein
MNKGLITTILKCLVAVFILTAFNVAAQTVKVTVEPSGDFSRFSKYAWQENRINARQTREVNARMEKAIKDAVNSELANKGYSLDLQAPDFYINVEAIPVDDVSLSGNNDFGTPIGTTVYTSQMPDGLGVSVLAAVIPRICITATDPSSKKPVWQVLTTKKYKDPDKAIRNLDREISQIIKKSLKNFPLEKGQSKKKN